MAVAHAAAIFFPFPGHWTGWVRAVHHNAMKFRVPDMSCGHCVATIERAIRAEDDAARVACELGSRTVDVDGRLDAAAVVAALATAGYAAIPV